MYDVYAGVAKNAANLPIYLLPAPGPPTGASHRDAAAGAAFTTLSKLFKTQSDFFEAQLSAFNINGNSYDYGVAVGNALLADRAADPGVGDDGYMV